MLLPARNQCLNACPVRYFEFNEICACKPCSLTPPVCSSDCLTCFGKKNFHCLSCFPGKSLLTDRYMCVSSCPLLKYFSYGPYCVPCHPSCQTCLGQSPNNCRSCESGKLFVPAQSTCVSQCAEGYFPRHGQCEQCDANCRTCADAPTQCTSCPAGLFLDQGSKLCSSACGANRAPDFQGNCEPCHESCKTCKQ